MMFSYAALGYDDPQTHAKIIIIPAKIAGTRAAS
jgi:hypothetical protein